MGRNEEEGVRLFSVVPTEITRGNGHRSKSKTFTLNTKHSLTVRVVKHCSRILREMVKSPSAEIFDTQLDTALGSQLWLFLD